jgi:hypothetical protein
MRDLAIRLRCAIAALSVASACASPGAYDCREDAQCVLADVQGVCAPPGFCAFPSESCPSGYRFGAHAAQSALACVPEPGSETTTSSANDPSTTQSTLDVSDVSDGSSSSDAPQAGTTGLESTSTGAEDDDAESSTGAEPSGCPLLWESDLSASTGWDWTAGAQVEVSFGPGGLLISPHPATPAYGVARWMEPVPRDVEVTAHMLEALRTDVAETLLILADPIGADRALFFVSGGTVNMQVRIDGQIEFQLGPAYVPGTHEFLRIRNREGFVSFSFSDDGVTYRELWKTAGLNHGDAYYVSLNAGLWEATPESVGQARFAWIAACSPND